MPPAVECYITILKRYTAHTCMCVDMTLFHSIPGDLKANTSIFMCLKHDRETSHSKTGFSNRISFDYYQEYNRNTELTFRIIFDFVTGLKYHSCN